MKLLADGQAIRYGDVLVDGERWPGFLHVIQHPQGRVLVDTGLIDSTPALDEEWSPRFDPDAIPRDVVCAINTHLHFDHCGGNRLFAGIPIYLQRLEREAARAEDYTIPDWVVFEGATYLELEGEQEGLPGLRVVPTPDERSLTENRRASREPLDGLGAGRHHHARTVLLL